MRTITPYLLQLYLASLTIRERLSLLDRIKQVDQTENLENQINAWKLKVGETSDLFFSKRLAWSHIKEIDLAKLLCPIKEFDFDGFDFPKWVSDIEKFQVSGEVACVPPSNNEDIPFSDALCPFVNYFYLQIKDIPSKFSDSALNDLKRGLLKHLSKISSQSLLEQMSELEVSYQEFVLLLRENNYKTFFTEYPYLSKLIFIRGRFWMENTTKLFRALKSDKHIIMGKLGKSSLYITKLKVDLSESHNYGKNVIILDTSNGSFVFKHRSVDAESRFFNFLYYLNSKLTIKQYVPWIINGKDYGWMEYIAQKPCANNTEVADFYKRIGSQLCLHYIFGSTDLHSENFIACGEFPVFIDLETILNPLTRLNNKHLNNLNKYIDIKFGLSVSRTGILPQWLMGPDTNVYNNSSLGGSKAGLVYPNIIWKNINTDQMFYDYIELPPPEDKNLVYLNSQYQDPSRFTKEIMEGFAQTYNYFLENKNTKALINEFHKFSNMQVRFVFRATKVYTLLLEYLNHPDYMRSGVERAIEMDILAKGLLVDLTKKYIFWDVLEDELAQLENNDVPYYLTNTSTKSLMSVNRELYASAFQYKAYDRFLRLISTLNLDDLAFQTQIIKSSVETVSKKI